jgi:hypothetical protein
MDEFSFLSVLISVILGLAVTEILQGFRGLLLSRKPRGTSLGGEERSFNSACGCERNTGRHAFGCV